MTASEEGIAYFIDYWNNLKSKVIFVKFFIQMLEFIALSDSALS